MRRWEHAPIACLGRTVLLLALDVLAFMLASTLCSVQTSNYDGTDKNSKFLNENREVKPLWADYPLEIQQCSATGFNPKLPIN